MAGGFAWKDQVVVVTGGGTGIGAAVARDVARRGGALALTGRRAEPLDQVARSLPPRDPPHLAVAADVTRRADVERVAAAALERFGHVDVWINNAGRGITRAVEQLTDEDIDAMMRDNVKSALYGMQTILPHFKARGRGQIVNVSSMLGRVPFVSFRSAYSASKHALNALTENLRGDLAKEHPGIVVTCVMPGVVTTDFGLRALHGGPDSRSFPGAQSAEEVAAIIGNAIEGRTSGDVYTRPEAIEAVVKYFRDLAGA